MSVDMVLIENYLEKVSLEEVKVFEDKVGLVFPDDYKKFLIKHNGGTPSLDNFNFYGKEEGSTIKRFFGVTSNSKNSVDWILDVYEGRLPKDFLPVADDLGGNLILLDCSFEQKGVFFWDHEEEAEEGEEPTMDNMCYLSKNFDSFLSALE